MHTVMRSAAAIAILLAGTGCTSILGGIDFNGGTGGKTASSTGTGGSKSDSSAGTGGTTGTGGSSACSSACAGHTTCDSATAQCVCAVGWIGASCQTCVFFVDGAASGKATGGSWADAFTTVKPALDAAGEAVKGGASTCDVWARAGTYYVYASAASDTVSLRAGVGLYGGFAGTETSRSAADPAANPTLLSGHEGASGASSVTTVVTATDVAGATIDGFTIRDANGGGGVLVSTSSITTSATISNCEITANTASAEGGGIDVTGGAASVVSCNVHGNTAGQNGGGMVCRGDCTVKGTTFQANSAGTGGGLFVYADTFDASGDSFIDNVANVSDAGGMLLGTHTAGVTFQDMIFHGNVAAGLGGAIYSTRSSFTLTNGLFYGNRASGGGAIANDTPDGFSCVNCTITGNVATTSQGGGIYWSNGAPTLANTIVWGNPSRVATTKVDVFPPTWSGAPSVLTSSCDVGGYTGTDETTFDEDPGFAAAPELFDWTTAQAVSAGSVAVALGSIYTVGDLLEIGGDGTSRAVTKVLGSTVSFTPALSAPAGGGVPILDWGATFAALDLTLAAGSPCAGTGDPTAAPPDDLAGHPRSATTPDIGAY